MSWLIDVWGDQALFTDPVTKVERVSYPVMTPSAARGLLESIMWHPYMKWVIDRIIVCNPVEYMNCKRKEMKGKIKASDVKKVMEGKADFSVFQSDANQEQTLRSARMLKNVHYVIEAHYEMTEKANTRDNEGKAAAIISDRLKKGKCYRTPYFGTRECRAYFQSCDKIPECPPELKGTYDLGWMLWDMDYSDPQNIKPMFFHAMLVDGVLEVPHPTNILGGLSA